MAQSKEKLIKKETRNAVEKLLREAAIEAAKNPNESNIDVRDDDLKLILNVWCKELNLSKKQSVLSKFTFLEFSKSFLAGQLSTPETIRRARQKLQETNKDLRGRFYNERHEREVQMKDELRLWAEVEA